MSNEKTITQTTHRFYDTVLVMLIKETLAKRELSDALFLLAGYGIFYQVFKDRTSFEQYRNNSGTPIFLFLIHHDGSIEAIAAR
jgi:hypothetical protein